MVGHRPHLKKLSRRNCLNLKHVWIKPAEQLGVNKDVSQLEGPEFGSQLLVPPPPIRNVPLITTAWCAQENGRKTAAATFLFLTSLFFLATLPLPCPFHCYWYCIYRLREVFLKVKPMKMYLMALPNDLFLNKCDNRAFALQNYM